MQPAPYNPDTLKLIRRGARHMGAEEIARLLGWPLAQLLRIGRKHGIDLRETERAETP